MSGLVSFTAKQGVRIIQPTHDIRSPQMYCLSGREFRERLHSINKCYRKQPNDRAYLYFTYIHKAYCSLQIGNLRECFFLSFLNCLCHCIQFLLSPTTLSAQTQAFIFINQPVFCQRWSQSTIAKRSKIPYCCFKYNTIGK